MAIAVTMVGMVAPPSATMAMASSRPGIAMMPSMMRMTIASSPRK